MTPQRTLALAAFLLCSTTFLQARADTFAFSFAGPNVSGQLAVQYGATTDPKYAQAYAITGISGTFTDANIGVVGATVTGFEPLNLASPQPTNTLAPGDFSKFSVASGLPPYDHGTITYDNLFWPEGSPQTGSDYPFFGGVLDVYGLLFDLSNGDVVNLWSNGVVPPDSDPDYGLAVVTHAQSLDYVGGGISTTPEPGTLLLLGTGALTLAWNGASMRRKRT